MRGDGPHRCSTRGAGARGSPATPLPFGYPTPSTRPARAKPQPPCHSLAARTPPVSFSPTLIANVAWKENPHHFPLSAANARAVLPKKPAGPCSAALPTPWVTAGFLFIPFEEKNLSAGFETSLCI